MEVSPVQIWREHLIRGEQKEQSFVCLAAHKEFALRPPSIVGIVGIVTYPFRLPTPNSQHAVVANGSHITYIHKYIQRTYPTHIRAVAVGRFAWLIVFLEAVNTKT